METLERKLSNLKAFRDSMQDIMETVTRENESELFRMNAGEQLYEKGIRADGSAITPPYALMTVSIKTKKGQPTDRVTLNDTGAFYSGFFVEYIMDGFILSSSDSKTKKLTSRYGEGIFGLTESCKQYFAEEILLPALLTEINNV